MVRRLKDMVKSGLKCYAIPSKAHFDEGRNTMSYTLKQAAEATGKSKPTILRAIQTGKISASRHEVNKGWLIDPSELHRVYPPVSEGGQQDETQRNVTPSSNISMLRRELELKDEKLQELRAERDRERKDLQERIADLSARLDREGEERRKVQAQLTGLLTDQRQKQESAPTEKPKKGLFFRLFGG